MNPDNPSSLSKFLAVPASAFLLVSLLVPGIGQAEEVPETPQPAALEQQTFSSFGRPQASGALTLPPPPLYPSADSRQDLIHNKYLKNGMSSLQVEGGTEAYIAAMTITSAAASQSGVTASLQRWTGSSWVEEGGPMSSSSLSGSSTLSFNKNLIKGYYYRIKSEHWASGGGMRESSTVFSNTLLVSE
ncbi:hypothetical protein [Saccharibacillus qingshengii]|uniref:hypothetical protein n=1 Tax=Saccharibacillus qingshengii TaxID=1763540 RepID=UPI001555C667|nr:hypothetical protein [Saccharibacillus qingshengii]